MNYFALPDMVCKTLVNVWYAEIIVDGNGTDKNENEKLWMNINNFFKHKDELFDVSNI